MSPAVCAHNVYAHADQAASSDPSWIIIVAVGGCFLAIVVLGAWLYRQDGPDDSGGHGGSGGPPPEPPPPDGPTWWPEFEREFAAYVAGKDENEKRPVPVARCLTPLQPGVSQCAKGEGTRVSLRVSSRSRAASELPRGAGANKVQTGPTPLDGTPAVTSTDKAA